MAAFTFNTAAVTTTDDLIPAGRYNVEIVASDLVATKANDGHYIKLTFSILDGDYAGRYIWANLNVDNPNPKAVEMAERDLKRICTALGVEEFENTEELHGQPLTGLVSIKPASGGYDASNNISRFEAINDNELDDNAKPW
jgi:hypothetical protein